MHSVNSKNFLCRHHRCKIYFLLLASALHSLCQEALVWQQGDATDWSTRAVSTERWDRVLLAGQAAAFVSTAEQQARCLCAVCIVFRHCSLCLPENQRESWTSVLVSCLTLIMLPLHLLSCCTMQLGWGQKSNGFLAHYFLWVLALRTLLSSWQWPASAWQKVGVCFYNKPYLKEGRPGPPWGLNWRTLGGLGVAGQKTSKQASPERSCGTGK